MTDSESTLIIVLPKHARISISSNLIIHALFFSGTRLALQSWQNHLVHVCVWKHACAAHSFNGACFVRTLRELKPDFVAVPEGDSLKLNTGLSLRARLLCKLRAHARRLLLC